MPAWKGVARVLIDIRNVWYTLPIGSEWILYTLIAAEVPMLITAAQRARSWKFRIPLVVLCGWALMNAFLVYAGSPLTLERLVWHLSFLVFLIAFGQRRRSK